MTHTDPTTSSTSLRKVARTAALFTAATGPHDLVSAVLVLAIALGIYWLIGRHVGLIKNIFGAILRRTRSLAEG